MTNSILDNQPFTMPDSEGDHFFRDRRTTSYSGNDLAMEVQELGFVFILLQTKSFSNED